LPPPLWQGDHVWDAVSAPAKDLLDKLLQVDPARRLTVEQVFAHPWMADEERSVHRRDLLKTMSKMQTSMKRRALPQQVPDHEEDEEEEEEARGGGGR
jgi:serine/threonine protein kinase